MYIDPNLKNFGYGLDTKGNAFEIENLSLKRDEKAIDKVKSKRDRCVKKSLWVDVVHDDGSIKTYHRESRRYYYLNKVVKRLEKRLRESTMAKALLLHKMRSILLTLNALS